jgi:hypothetical protein
MVARRGDHHCAPLKIGRGPQAGSQIVPPRAAFVKSHQIETMHGDAIGTALCAAGPGIERDIVVELLEILEGLGCEDGVTTRFVQNCTLSRPRHERGWNVA